MRSFCTDRFWDLYRSLPADIRGLADKTYALWLTDPDHPGIQFKRLKDQKQPVWQARIGANYRAFCTKDGDDFIWYWIGSKTEAKRLY